MPPTNDHESDLSAVLHVRDLHLRAVRQESRECDFVASTDAIDSYGEVVDQSWNLERFRANPVILFAHNSRELPIGQAVACQVVAGRLECTIRFASERANPKAEQVWQSICEKTLRAVSVGFNPRSVRAEKRNGQDVMVLADNDLYEISVTPIPANPEALAKARAKALAISPKEQPMPDPVNETAGDVLAEKDAQITEVRAAHDAALAKLAATLAERDESRAVLTQVRLERDTLAARVLDLEVDALVGKKILPAERDLMRELAAQSPDLYRRTIALRADLSLLAQVVPDQPAAQRSHNDDAGQSLVAAAHRLAPQE